MKKHFVCLLAASMAVTPNVTVVQADTQNNSAVESSNADSVGEQDEIANSDNNTDEVVEEEEIETEAEAEEETSTELEVETETEETSMETTENTTEDLEKEDEEVEVSETAEVTTSEKTAEQNKENETEEVDKGVEEEEEEGTTESTSIETTVSGENEEEKEKSEAETKTETETEGTTETGTEVGTETNTATTTPTEKGEKTVDDVVATAGAIDLQAIAPNTLVTYACTGGNIYIDSTGTVVKADEGITQANIPSTVQGTTVTAIGEGAFKGNTNLTNVTIPSTVTVVGDSAFQNCTGLNDVSLNSRNVESIGSYAFSNTGITRFDLQNFQGTYGEGVFKDCAKLRAVWFTSLREDKAQNKVPAIPKSMCENCPNLTNVLGLNVFYYGNPDYTTSDYRQPASIGERAFANTGLRQIYLLDEVNEVASDAFADCPNLKYIHTTHQSGAKQNTSYTGTPAKVYFIGEDADFDAGSYDNSICTKETIGHYDSATKTVTFTATVPGQCAVKGSLYATYNEYAYQSLILNKIEKVVVNDGIVALSSETFANSKSLKEVELPSSVKFDSSAFQNCTALEKITVPEDGSLFVNSVLGCTALKSLTIPAGVQRWSSWGTDTFKRNGWFYKDNWNYMKYNNTIGSGLETLPSLEELNIGEGWEVLDKGGYFQTTQPIKVNLPSTLKEIKANFFRGLNAKTITIPDGVTSIGDYAFRDSKLEEITIPASVTEMGDDIFENCKNLKTVRVTSGSVADKYEYPPTIKKEYSAWICGDDITASLDRSTGVLTLTGTGAMYDYSENSAPWDSLSDEIKSVVISDGITSVGNLAFHNAINLTSVTIPDTVQKFGTGAFQDCTSLSTVNIPDGVAQLSKNMFNGCTNLTGISLPNTITTIDTGAFEGTGLTSISLVKVKEIGDSAFKGTKLQAITLPTSLLKIGANAFEGNLMTTLEVPEGVVSIGAGAFSNCANLKEVTLPSSLSTMGKGIFENDKEFSLVYLVRNSTADEYDYTPATKQYTGDVKSWKCGATSDDNVTAELNTTTGVLTIKGTGSMKDYTSRASVPWYGSRAQIKLVRIADTVTNIGSFAFSGCSNLTDINIPESITKVGDNAFLQDFKLASVDMSSAINLTELGTNAFAMCTGLTEVNLAPNLVTIGSSAFYSCTLLPKVILPQNVQRIGDNAFGGCTSLKSVTIPKGVIYMGTLMFQNGTPLETVYLYHNSVADTYGEYPENITKVYLDEKGNVWNVGTKGHETDVTASFDSETGTLVISGSGAMADFTTNSCPWKAYSSQIKKAIVNEGVTRLGNRAFYDTESLSSVELPNSLTSIGEMAFGGTINLKNVSLPNGLSELNDKAFMDSGVENVDLPSTLTKLGTRVFQNTELKTITIPEGVTEIGSRTFEDCVNLTTVTLPNTLKVIGERAFTATSLTGVTIPSSVSVIGDKAFSGITFDTLTFLTPAKDSQENAVINTLSISDNAFDTVKTGKVYLYRGSVADSYVRFPKANKIYLDEDSWECGAEGNESSVIATLNRETGELNITGNGAMRDYTTVKETPWFDSLNLIRKVTINEGVTNVGSNTFNGCANLGTVELPYGLTSIGTASFKDCKELFNLELPNTLGKVGNSAFENCVFIETLNMPDSITEIGNSAFAGCSRLEKLSLSANLTVLGANAFKGCSNLATINIPNSVQSIGASAFENTGITSITIPTSVKTLGNSAFKGCEELTKAVIGAENVDGTDLLNTTANDNLLKSKLVEVEFNGINQKITNAKNMLSYLPIYRGNSVQVTLGKNLVSVDTEVDSLFGVEGNKDVLKIKVYHNSYADTYVKTPSTKYTKVYMDTLNWNCGVEGNETSVIATLQANGTLVITGNGQMRDFASIVDTPWYDYLSEINVVSVEDGVTSIGTNAFIGSALSSINLAETVTTVGNSAFKNCTNLREVTLPSQIISVAEETFSGCSSLTEVTLKGARTLEDKAFKDCTALNKITFETEKGGRIGIDVFTNCNPLDIYGYSTASYYTNYKADLEEGDYEGYYYPKGSKFHFLDSFEWDCGTEGHESEVKAKFDLETGTLAIVGKGAISDISSKNKLWGGLGNLIKNVVISDGITRIGADNFKETGITEIKLPNTITSIGEASFANTAITTIEFPENLEKIEANAFFGTHQLTTIHLPSNLKSVEMGAFMGADGLKEVYFNKGIEEIDVTAFYAIAKTPKIYLYKGTVADNPKLYPSDAVIKYLDESMSWECGTAKDPKSVLATLDRKTGILTLQHPETENNSNYKMNSYTDVTETPWYDYLDEIKEVKVVSLDNIGSNSFVGAKNLTKLSIGDVTKIEKNAFDGCINLSDVSLYDTTDEFFEGTSNDKTGFECSLKKIEDYAFRGCTSLSSIAFPRQMDMFGTGVFENCTSLNKVVFYQTTINTSRHNASTLDNTVFEGCNSLDIYGYATSHAYQQYKKGVFPTNSNFTLFELTWECGAEGHESDVIAKLNPDTGELVISGTGDMVSVVDNDTFWRIFPDSIKSVRVENGVKSIGASAFSNMTKLETVTIADSVTCVKDYAFSGCTRLKTIKLSDNITEIGMYAFYNTMGLNELRLPKYLQKLTATNALGCPVGGGIKSLVFGKEIQEVTTNALGNLPNLTTVYVYKGTGADNLELFQKASFKPVTLIYLDPDSEVNDSTQSLVFYCGKDDKESVKATLNRQTGVMTISGTGEMEDFTNPDKVAWKDYISEIKEIVVKDGVKSIGDYAFDYATNLVNIDWGNTIETIGQSSFEACYSLFKNKQWTGHPGYQYLELPVGLKTIKTEAFTDNELVAISIPETVEYIGNGAFGCSPNISEITIYTKTANIEPYAFDVNEDEYLRVRLYKNSTADKYTYYPNGTTKVYLDSQTNKREFTWECGDNLTATLNLDTQVLRISGEGDMYGYDDESEAPWAKYNKQIKSVIVGEGVISIGENAFASTEINLKLVSLPSTLESIGARAFATSTILSTELPDNLSEICNGAFEGCKGLDKITIPASAYIEDNVFSNSSLREVTINSSSIGYGMFTGCKNLEKVTISIACEEISRSAFTDCPKLKELTLPKELSVIKSNAFDSNLAKVYVYHNSVADKYSYPTNTEKVYLDNLKWNCGEQGDNVVAEFNETTGELKISGTGRMADYKYTESPWYYTCGNKITSIIVEDGVTYIGNHSFWELKNVTSVELADSIEEIGKYSLSGTRIKSITLPANLKIIREGAFADTSITEITIPNGVVRMDNGVFESCSRLETVDLPDTLIYLDDEMFISCDKLKAISLPKSLEYVGTDLIWSSSITDVNVYFGSVADKMDFYDSDHERYATKHYLDNPHWNCGEQGNNVVAELDMNTGVLTLTGKGKTTNYSWNNVPWESYRDLITSVEVSDGITSIGKYFFYNCDNIANVKLPNTLEFLGESAFEGISSLKEIELPSSLTGMGVDVFKSTGLQKVIINGTVVGKEMFLGCEDLAEVELTENCTTIKAEAFGDCPSLKKITIPKNVTEIQEGAFSNTDLTDVYLYFNSVADNYTGYPTSVTKHYLDNPHWDCGEQGDNVTAELDNNTGVLTVKGTGRMADYKSARLTPWGKLSSYISSVVIENGVTYVGNYAFASCDSAYRGGDGLGSVVIANTVTEVGNYSFADTMANSIKFSTNLKHLGQGSFANINVATIELPEGLTTLDDSVFENSIVERATLPTTLKQVGTSVFSECNSLKEVEIKGTEIGELMFYNCMNLYKVSIPNCERIEDYAFEYCNSLKEITLLKSVTTMGEEIFKDSGLKDVYLYRNSVADRYKYAWKTGKHYLDSELVWNCGIDGSDSVIAKLDKTTGVLTITGKGAMQNLDAPWGEGNADIKEVVIKSGVTTVGEYMFASCPNIGKVTLPDTITTICDGAFEGSGVTTINIPSSVKTILSDAFQWCENLQYITLPDGLEELGNSVFVGCTSLVRVSVPSTVTTIGDYIFEDCTSLVGADIRSSIVTRSMFSGCTSLKTVTLSNNCTAIKNGAFKDCENLETITIPYTVTEIADNVFSGTNLKTVYLYHNSVADNYKYPTNPTKVYLDTYVWNVGLDKPETIKARYDNSTKTLTLSGTGKTGDVGSIVGKNTMLNVKKVIIKDGITGIGANSFSSTNGGKNIATVEFSNTLGDIGADAFNGTAIKYVILPATVSNVGDRAFANCSKIEFFRAETGTDYNTLSLGSRVFENCTKIDFIELDNRVISIGSDVAKNSSVKTIRLYRNTVADKYTEYPTGANKYYMDNEVSEIPNSIEGWMFNYDLYKQNRGDLLYSFGDNPVSLYNHWVLWGIGEGSIGSYVFDAKYYVKQYSTELAKYYPNFNSLSTTEKNRKAFEHYKTVGLLGGYSGTAEFNYNAFLNNNPELRKYAKDIKFVLNYYVKYAKPNGLSAKVPKNTTDKIIGLNTSLFNKMDKDKDTIFCAKYYAEHTNDSKAKNYYANGDIEALYDYWKGTLDKDGNYTKNSGVNLGESCSPVYDATYYRKNNPDILVAKPWTEGEYGNKPYINTYGEYGSLYFHFVNWGIKEGRKTSANFDVQKYKANNPDLAKGYGDDIRSYYEHYILFGQYENRITK